VTSTSDRVVYVRRPSFSVIVRVTNTSYLRRSCCLWQCPEDLQSHNAPWFTPRRGRTLFLLRIPRVPDDLERLWRSLFLVLWLLLHIRFGHMVWYRSDIREVLPGHESTRNRQEYASVRLQITAIRRMVVCLWVRARPFCAYPLS